jgi:hypothetical protein
MIANVSATIDSPDDWVNFFCSSFGTRLEAEAWVARCETSPPPNVAMTMMRQTQRLISIADDIPTIRPHTESLQLFFLVVCAEHVAKLYHQYPGEGQSKEYVNRFFDEFVLGSDRQTLSTAFIDVKNHLLRPLSFREAVDTLYKIRCDVAHEGNIWGFAFGMINDPPPVDAKISLSELRDIIVRGCIEAVSRKLPTP